MATMVQLRGLIVHHHLVIDGDDAFLIDGGFLGGISRTKRELSKHGMNLRNIRALILTHGHLDHSLNAAKIQKLSGCRVFVPGEDRLILEGKHPYRGWTKVCGWLEAIGRFLLRYRPPEVDEWFAPDTHVCGFKTISLPGHTEGHCGILLEEQKLLIAGDLFARQLRFAKPPPFFLNINRGQTLESIRKASLLDLEGISVCHGRKTSPQQALKHLRDLARSMPL